MLDDTGFPIVGTVAHNTLMCTCGAPVGYVCACENARVLLILQYENRKTVSEPDTQWVEIPYSVRNVQLFVSKSGEYCKFVYDPERGSAHTSYWQLKTEEERDASAWME